MQTYTYNMYIYINYRLLDASQICNEYICIHVYACFLSTQKYSSCKNIYNVIVTNKTDISMKIYMFTQTFIQICTYTCTNMILL